MRTAIAAIVGGTASSLGGGKFANGAISGAFVHMFNAEMGKLLKHSRYYSQKRIDKMRAFQSTILQRGQAIQYNLQSYSKPMIAAGITGIMVITGTEILYPVAMSYPLESYAFTEAAVNPMFTVQAAASKFGWLGQSAGWIARKLLQ